MSIGSGWMGSIDAADVADLGYVRAWSAKPRMVTAEIANELAFFGPRAPQRRSVLGFTRAADVALKPVDRSTWQAPGVGVRQRLLSAAARNELIEVRGIPESGDPRVAADLERLIASRGWTLVPSGRHDFRSPARRDPTVACVVPTSNRLGRISEFCSNYSLSFNSGYYIWLEEEFADGFASSGDPIGLEIVDGVVTSPPTASRSALLRVIDEQGRDRLSVRQVGVGDLTITFPGGLRVHAERAACRCARSYGCVSVASGAARVLSRAYGSAAVVDVPQGFVGLTIYGRQVVQIGYEQIPCPVNGLALLVSATRAQRTVEQLLVSCWVMFDLELNGARALSGSQVGPTIVRASEVVDVAAEIAADREIYRPSTSHGKNALPPVSLTSDKIIQEQRGRAAVGVTPSGDVRVLVAEGCEPRSMEPGYDVLGSTLAEMTDALLGAGCCDAVTLDSGGAANMARWGNLALSPADRNDVVGVPFERYVPGAWRLASSSEAGWLRAW
ncbi:phosphodiester glycosidase family protein [Arthrobacter woluwensis]|uniref:phosphodiester glycosidase family protein n=1 Tax=Arthrobacter woluwensis TaxID=156980 RepID=UPI00382882A8